MSTYSPEDNLGLAGGHPDTVSIIRYEMVPHLSLIDLTDLRNFCTRRIDALQKVNEEHGWWKVQGLGEPEDILNNEEKCLILGQRHVEFNPGGVAMKINAIKSVRSRRPFPLKESKELCEAYALRVHNGVAEPPNFPTVGPNPEDVPDFKRLEDELI